ncbi:MAG: hypothetical protein SFU85_02355 [Candidatus Methylacidiphilales bacterium]|nr:hypothetical protein [Candidatus Methylacidiphilales bacterium]
MKPRSKFAPRTVRTSEKAKLLAAVGDLVAKMGRPVCSDDLRSHLNTMEDQERVPFFAQCWGQVLLKAARPRPEPFPYLRCLGKIGNRAYYALEDTQELRLALGRHKDTLRAKVGASWRLAEAITNLIGTPYEAQARNAAAGFVQEFGPLSTLDERLAGQVEEARKWVVGPFVAREPSDWITRKEALALLKEAATRCLGPDEASQIKYQKILTAWQWPQSELFMRKGLRYSRSQIACVAKTKWGHGDDGGLALGAAVAISRYSY